MAKGSYQIRIETDSLVYANNSQYYPKIVVYETPYESGDCPVDEIILNSLESVDGVTTWSGDITSDYGTRAVITDSEVMITCTDENPYEDGKSYEVRIYPSDEAVNRQE